MHIRESKGTFLMEIVLSIVIIGVIVYVVFAVFDFLGGRNSVQDKKLRAVYVARSKLEEILAMDFDSINETLEGCQNIDDYVGVSSGSYLKGQICVDIEPVSDWPNGVLSAKQVKVTVNYE